MQPSCISVSTDRKKGLLELQFCMQLDICLILVVHHLLLITSRVLLRAALLPNFLYAFKTVLLSVGEEWAVCLLFHSCFILVIHLVNFSKASTFWQ